MQTASWAILGVVGLSITATVGDCSLKLASACARPLQNHWCLIGSVVYGMTSLGWIHVMRHLKLATVGSVCAVTNVLLLAVLGALIFREPLSRSESLGIVLGVLSLCLLTRAA